MNAVCLRVFVTESSRHDGRPIYEWLLEEAQSLGITGGSAFRALAGFGRHGRQDAGFFELAGELPVVVEFFVEPALTEPFLKRVAEAGLSLPYAKLPAEMGVTA